MIFWNVFHIGKAIPNTDKCFVICSWYAIGLVWVGNWCLSHNGVNLLLPLLSSLPSIFVWRCVWLSLYVCLYSSRTLRLCSSLQWRHNELDGVSNHQSHDCLLKRLFRRRSKKTSKLCVTILCEGNSPVTGKCPAERASNAENISIWWCHHVFFLRRTTGSRLSSYF